MKEEDLKRGHIYRYGRSSMVVLLIFEWPAEPEVGKERQFEYLLVDHTGTVANNTSVDFARTLAAKCSSEVRPPIAWVSVDSEGSEVCSGRGWHDMPSSLPDARCRDCGKTLAEVAAEHAARPRPAPEEEQPAEPAPEEPEAGEITADDLLKSYLG